MEAVTQAIQSKLVTAAQMVESKLDAEIERLENLDQDDLEQIRENRLKQMKKLAQLKQEWKAMGHGAYEELAEEKEFFEVVKKSKDIVCHFYKNDSLRCKIVDHHLKILAPSHIEARFIKLDVERCPFLTERLRIKIIPTIALVKDCNTKDYIVGFTDLGNCDDFSTEMLEWRIAQSGAIKYDGDLLRPPTEESKRANKSLLRAGMKKKTIQGGRHSDSDDSGDD